MKRARSSSDGPRVTSPCWQIHGDSYGAHQCTFLSSLGYTCIIIIIMRNDTFDASWVFGYFFVCCWMCCLVLSFFLQKKKTKKKKPHCTWEKQAFVPKPVIQRLKKIPNWKLSSINQYSTDCSVGMLFLLCGMWVPAAPASLYLVSGDLYILNWRKPVSSQAPSGVCSSLQTATSSGRKDECVCPAWHHAFIIHKRTLQAGVLQPPPPSCVVLVSSRGSYTSTSSRMKINILLRSAGCRRTVPPQRENLEAVTKH